MAESGGLKHTLAVLVVMSMLTAVLTSQSPTTPPTEEDIEYVSGPIEIVFSFDTTGSMYSVLRRVRNVVSEMIQRLQSDIPGIRMGVIAHGDYQDKYCTKHVDLTSDAEALRKFVMEVDSTGGGDSPEAYEEVLRLTASELSWTPGSQRSLVLIGDDRPHEPSYPENQRNTDWRQESRRLANMGVKVYSIKALQRDTEYFYSTVANITEGYYLLLNDFDNIFDFIMAISYREYGIEYLEAYEEEVTTRLGNVPVELQKLFQTLKQTAGPGKVTSNGKRVKRIPWQPPPTLPPVTVRPKVPKYMDVQLLKIRSDIAYRFATTNITTRLANRDETAQEAIFNVQLPKNAFISNFSMFINGTEYPGEVKEKHAAKVKYDKARQRGETAAHITAVPRNTNSFKVAVNVASGEKVTFELMYQELLERRLGVYEHVIHVDPGQSVRDFTIEVNIHETRDIRHLRVPPIRNDIMNMATVQEDNQMVTIERESPNKAQILFKPSVEEQEAMSNEGVRGQFVVQYDVSRTQDGGEIEVVDGYFVHFLAPEGLPATNKNVLFVLDTSGSMAGTKIMQVKDAMNTILSQLQPGDYFNVMGFSSFFRYWDETDLRPASQGNIADAKEWVENMISAGATHIVGALDKGLRLLNSHSQQTSSKIAANMLVFLTDGKPTVGERDPDKIVELVRTQMNPNNFTIFALGFGNDVDFPFLKELSCQAQGFARRIYADSDAALQLQDFFREISSPVLSDVNVTYLGPVVNSSSLTTTTFKHFFNDTEIVICGEIIMDDFELPEFPGSQEPLILRSEISAVSAGGEWSNSLVVEVDKPDNDKPSARGIVNNMERLWAYLSIKELLDQVLKTPDKEQKEQLKQKALELSLKYHFVTSVTSMVVTKPDEENVEEGIEDPDEKRPEKAPDYIVPSRRKTAHSSPGGGYSTRLSSYDPGLAGLPGLPGPPGLMVLAALPERPRSYDIIRRPMGRITAIKATESDVLEMPPRKMKKPKTKYKLKKDRGRKRFMRTRAPEISSTHAPTTDKLSTTSSTTAVPELPSSTTTVPEVGTSELDGDPQFAIQVKGSSTPICFNAQGRPGDTVQLLHDPKLNLTINAILIGRPYMVLAEIPMTFIGAISIIQNSVEKVKVTPTDVEVDENNKKWKGHGRWYIKAGELGVSLERVRKDKKFVKVTLGRDIQFRVIRNMVKATTASEGLGKVDHLLFYVKKNRGLSGRSSGLLGQFKKMGVRIDSRGSGAMKSVVFSGRSQPDINVHAKHRADAATSWMIPCWQVVNGWSILKGTIEDYVVPSIRYPGLAPGLEVLAAKPPRRLRHGRRNRPGSSKH